MIGVLGVSKKDVPLAIRWLHWVAFLCRQPGGDSRGETLNVMLTRNISSAECAELMHEAKGRGMFKVQFWYLGDENEAGYPISASHLFIRSLEHCEKNHAGEPVLWIEPDAVPVRAGWFQGIAAEYEACPMPFMGHVEAKHYTPHLAGVAVYPPDWRTRSPLLAGVLHAPDVKAWGRGLGQAFDMYAGPDLVKQSAQSRTIQQIWRATSDEFQRIGPDTCLFHQCKTGRLIGVIASQRYPRYKPLPVLP